MTMEKNAAVFLKVSACDGSATGMLRVEGSVKQDDVLAVECAVALANRHRRLPGVVPHSRKAIAGLFSLDKAQSVRSNAAPRRNFS
jgi:hypothetical protein